MVIHLFPSHFPFRVSYLVKFLSSLSLFTPFLSLCSFFRSFAFLHYFLCFSWVSAFFSPFLSVFHALISLMLIFSILVLFPFYPLFASFPFLYFFPSFLHLRTYFLLVISPVFVQSILFSLISPFQNLSNTDCASTVLLGCFAGVRECSSHFFVPFFSDMTSASPTSRLVVVNVIVVVSVIGKF